MQIIDRWYKVVGIIKDCTTIVDNYSVSINKCEWKLLKNNNWWLRVVYKKEWVIYASKLRHTYSREVRKNPDITMKYL